MNIEDHYAKLRAAASEARTPYTPIAELAGYADVAKQAPPSVSFTDRYLMLGEEARQQLEQLSHNFYAFCDRIGIYPKSMTDAQPTHPAGNDAKRSSPLAAHEDQLNAIILKIRLLNDDMQQVLNRI